MLAGMRGAARAAGLVRLERSPATLRPGVREACRVSGSTVRYGRIDARFYAMIEYADRKCP